MEEAGYVKMLQDQNGIEIYLNVEDDKVRAIGEKMNAINEDAYMNGYNWEAFLHYYLYKNAPEVLDGMNADPEAGMYAVGYRPTVTNQAKAERLMEIINSLFSNEQEIYRILQEEGDEIEWD